MRERDAGRDDLESSRLELTDRQRQLFRALVEWHLRRADRDAV